MAKPACFSVKAFSTVGAAASATPTSTTRETVFAAAGPVPQ